MQYGDFIIYIRFSTLQAVRNGTETRICVQYGDFIMYIRFSTLQAVQNNTNALCGFSDSCSVPCSCSTYFVLCLVCSVLCSVLSSEFTLCSARALCVCALLVLCSDSALCSAPCSVCALFVLEGCRWLREEKTKIK